MARDQSKQAIAELEALKSAPRPRKPLRERLFHTLPRYTGPYSVGYLEIEVPAREPRTFSHIKRDNEDALRLETVLFSIYYPCEPACEVAKKRSRVRWLPDPRIQTCHGYAKFLSIPNLPVTAYIASTTMFTKLPAYRNANLAQHRPISNASQTSTPSSGDVEDYEKKPTFPVVFFSHGLGGSRTNYSTICGELASFGLVVVAMEHRDGSGARTYVNLPPGSKKRFHDLESQELDRSLDGDEKKKKKKKPAAQPAQAKPYYKVDYLFPEDNAQDTAPNNPRGVDHELRGAQIDMRLAEIEEAYHVLSLLNSGQGEFVGTLNLRRQGYVGAHPAGLSGIDWSAWTGRVHLDNITIMGHSFGGATSIQALRLEERFTWIGQGVLLDPWGLAMPADSEHRIRKPLLSIGSEAFMHWEKNFDRVHAICREALHEGALCWQVTIRGSTHLSQTDFAVLYPNWMSLLMKTIVDPRRALYLTTTSALELLATTLPEQQRYSLASAWATEALLERDADSESDILIDHRPDEKWIAARLKIENELSFRLANLFRRKRWSKRLTPAAGFGRRLSHWAADKEIWMHLRP
jgi:platelet-activating factor acetylhydrolase